MIQTVEFVRQHIVYKRDHERLSPVVAGRMLAALDAGEPADYMALWRAATWPTPPAKVFHTAPPAKRASIETEGLTPSQPGTGNWRPRPGCVNLQASQPVGVYVGESPDEQGIWTHWPSWDIWCADVDGLDWVPDPINPGYWCITVAIAPDRISLWRTCPR